MPSEPTPVAAGESQPVLSTDAAVPFVPPLAPAAAPSVLGYEAVRPLGQGGMGVVWEARQLGLGRAVALKLIRPGLGGSEEVARFVAEAQALAAVEHPHVVRVHEVGRHAGAPYMAMEYVAGGSLAQRLRQGPLPPGEAARVVELAARGVQAAHDRGIVHRDLKPGNVLLTEHGEPKVGDFGLARRVEEGAGLTRTGVVMGTPSYMAPEQARGDAKRVGPAADVYGLGAILYECLTGRPPFVGPQTVDVLLQVVNDEPVAVRALQPKAPRDLETIAHKCLHKEPARRYASAQALADDLERYLEARPIRARPVGVAERAWKWARRHPAVAWLLALLVVGVGLAFWAVKAEQERTAKERDRAIDAEREAKDNFEQARRAVDECFGLAKDDPALQAEHMRGVRKLLLEKTLSFYQGFLRRAGDDPALAARQAEYLLRVAQITGNISNQADAARWYEQARDVYDRLCRDRPEVPEHRASLAFACNSLGLLCSLTGKRAEAQANYKRAAELYTALRRADPNEPRYQVGLAQVYDNQATLLLQSGQREEAARRNRQALDLRLRLAKAYPQVAAYQNDLATTWTSLGRAQFESDPPGAVASYQEAANIWLKLSQSAPAGGYQWQLGVAQGSLAFTQDWAGVPQEAEGNYRRALGLLDRLAQLHPEVIAYRDQLANTWNNRGIHHRRAGQTEEAIASWEKARDIFRDLHKAYPERTAFPFGAAQSSMNMGGTVHEVLGDPKGSLVHFDEAIRLLEPLHQRQRDEVYVRGRLISAYRGRAAARNDLGQHKDAAADFEAAYQLGGEPRRLTFLCQKATALARGGDVALAQKLAGDGELARKLDPEGLYRLAVLHAVLAQAAAPARPLPLRERDAEAQARRAVAVLERARQAGWFRDQRAREEMSKDKNLAVLRDRADFRQWAAGLGTGGKRR